MLFLSQWSCRSVREVDQSQVDVDTEIVGGTEFSCLVCQVPLGSPSGLEEGSRSAVVVRVWIQVVAGHRSGHPPH